LSSAPGLVFELFCGSKSLYQAFSKTNKVLTWSDVEKIETEALLAGDVKGKLPKGTAAATVKKAIQNLKDAGITKPTRIPWGEK
jgi:hypothetical protein